MRLLARAFPYLVIGAILATVIWAVHNAGRDAGYSDGYREGQTAGREAGHSAGKAEGDKEGFARGVESAGKTHDAALTTLIAQAREAAEKARADGFQKALEQERARQDEIQQAARRLEQDKRQLASRVDSLLRRVRRAEAPSPADSSSGGVPPSGQSADGDVGPTDPAGLLYEADRRMVGESGAADYEAGRFLSCLRWIYGPQVRTTGASE